MLLDVIVEDIFKFADSCNEDVYLIGIECIDAINFNRHRNGALYKVCKINYR